MYFVASLLLLASVALSFAIPTSEASEHKSKAAGAKRGVSYNKAAYVLLFNGGKTNWAYNWDSSDNGLGKTGYEYSPLLHSHKNEHTSPWFARVDGYAKVRKLHLLGFNEPDMCKPGAGGACMTLAESVAGWRTWMEPLRRHGSKVKFGSPAVTNDNRDGKGLTYLKAFLDDCRGCHIDFVNIHWYDSATNIQYFKDHITAALKVAGGRPLWITEFWAEGSEDQIINFMREVLPWLDGQSRVHRYAMFMAAPGKLLNKDGTGLSRIGQAYNTI